LDGIQTLLVEPITYQTLMNRKIGDVVVNGGVFVYPTETQYALGTIATNIKAVRRIFEIKRRPPEKQLPVIVGSLEQARRFFVFSKMDMLLAYRFWPGAFSLILKTKSKRIASALGSDRVAVRVSSNRLAREIALLAGAPIVSTSANISGSEPCRTIRGIKKQFAGSLHQPDVYISGRLSKNKLPSTIVQTHDGSIKIVREGRVTINEILDAIG
jgi:L-threonylcarbamoyladenylate synthase